MTDILTNPPERCPRCGNPLGSVRTLLNGVLYCSVTCATQDLEETALIRLQPQPKSEVKPCQPNLTPAGSNAAPQGSEPSAGAAGTDDFLSFKDAKALDCNDADIERMGFTVPVKGGWTKPTPPPQPPPGVTGTPECDAFFTRYNLHGEGDISDFARTLETQRNAAQTALAAVQGERDEAIIKYTGQAEAAEQAHKVALARVESLRADLARAAHNWEAAEAELKAVTSGYQAQLAETKAIAAGLQRTVTAQDAAREATQREFAFIMATLEQRTNEANLASALAGTIRKKLTAAEQRAAEAEDTADDEWLNAIAAEWNKLTGTLWDTRDGETRQEGLRANVAALFEHFRTQRDTAIRERDEARKVVEAARTYKHHGGDPALVRALDTFDAARALPAPETEGGEGA